MASNSEPYDTDIEDHKIHWFPSCWEKYEISNKPLVSTIHKSFNESKNIFMSYQSFFAAHQKVLPDFCYKHDVKKISSALLIR